VSHAYNDNTAAQSTSLTRYLSFNNAKDSPSTETFRRPCATGWRWQEWILYSSRRVACSV